MKVEFSSLIAGRRAPKGREPNLAGDRYGRLTLLSEVDGRGGGKTTRKWLVRCQCASRTEKQVLLSNMRRGITTSCGCAVRESMASIGRLNATHKMHGNPLYIIWRNMLSRCKDPKNNSYKYYGGRGVSVCDEWESVENFISDMAATYQDGLSIDRIDNSLGYSRTNCRWSTTIEQARNKRNNIIVYFLGKKMTLMEATKIAGVKYTTAYMRINTYGWPISRALGNDFSEA